MDTTVVSALAAVLGSLVGGSATVVTAWVTQRTQSRREQIQSEIRKRERLYSDFIVESSKLAMDALDHTLENPEKFFSVYSLQNQIRLVSSDEVADAADQTMRRIIEQYFGPNLTREQLRELAMGSHAEDPVSPFSRACRRELASLRRHA
jgi:type VI protein secretion system component VasK